jgi:gamma-glutamyltranspeptidase / glutathione hydrolase
MKNVFLIFVLFATQAHGQLQPFSYSSVKSTEATQGAVVSAHPLASQAGIHILKLGGNAFDAAIATQFVLAVVYPNAGNLGGGGFMIAHTAKGKNIAIDYREKAPAKATKNMFLDSAGNPIAGLSMEGSLASGVPGSVAGIFEQYKYASLPLSTLIGDAIALAKNGFAITASQANDFNELKTVFEQNNKYPVAFVKNTPWKKGDTLVQPELAATLQRILVFGQDGFYQGETANIIQTEMLASGGIISLDDLMNYKARTRQAVSFNYRGHKIISMPLPSSGGVILQQLLTLAEHYKLAKYPFHSAAALNIMVEAERTAFADRANYLGDQDFVKVPIKTLVSKKYLLQKMANFTLLQARKSSEMPKVNIAESEETTHFNVVDKWGNAVSITTTLNNSYGSRKVIAGFIMNNEMDDFSIKTGVPNMYGALGNDKNAIAPNKRMLSSMTPTIVLKNNKPFLITGTPGGTTIPTSVFQTIVNIIDFKKSAQDAVNLPKFHHQHIPDVVSVEKQMLDTTKQILKNMGYTLQTRGAIGRTELIQIQYYPFKITAVADYRGDDDARGF